MTLQHCSVQRIESATTIVVIDEHPRVSRAEKRDRSLEISTSLVAELAGVAPHLVQITARCVDCGGAHGQRIVIAPESARLVRLSASYTGDFVVVAASRRTIGIDAEKREDAAARATAIDEVAGPSADALLHWTRVEAVLKAIGTGLRRDPREVKISGTAATIDGRAFDLLELAGPSELRVTLATERS